MSTEFIVTILLTIVGSLLGHHIASLKWLRNLMYCLAVLLALSIVPDKYFETSEKILISYKYLLLLLIGSIMLSVLPILPKRKIIPQAFEPGQKTQNVISAPSKEPEKPIDYEKFHTYNGLTFKYDSRDGSMYQGFYCHKDKIKLEEVRVGYYDSTFRCHICNFSFVMSHSDAKRIHETLKDMFYSHVKGHLKKLPSESERKNT